MSKNNNKSSKFQLNRLVRTGLVAAVAAGVASMANAGETIYFDHGGNLQWSLTTSYGLGMRMEKQDKKLMESEGNRNFDRGSLTTHRVSALGELVYTNDSYSWGEWGGVLRGSTFYDDVYHRKNDNKGRVNHGGKRNQFSSGAKYYSGGRTRFLDAYLFTDIQLPKNQYLGVKAGRHVVSWGEGLFYPGVNGAQGPVDVVKSTTPGTETKEVLLPNGQVSVDWNINPLFGLSAYYQYEWLPNELSPVGSYFSTNNAVGPRPDFMRPNGFAVYTGKNKPKSSGQYGLRATIRPNFDWEFSVFHINYHDKNPSGLLLPGPFDYSSYKINYFDNIKLTGASVSTRIGDTQVSGEISYRDGAPVTVLTPVREGNEFPVTATRGKGYQAQASFIHTLGDMPWARGTTILGEIVHVAATSVDAIKRNGQTYDKYSYNTSDDYQTKSATAFTGQVSLSYPGIFSGWDLSVPVSYSHVIDGKTPMRGAIGGGQGDRRLSVGSTFKRHGNLELNATYVAYMGEASVKRDRQLTDRDQLTFSAKYTF